MAFLHLLHHRFLAVNVLALAHGVDAYLLVPVVGGGVDDGVHVFALQDLAVVAGGEEVFAPQLLGPDQAAVVEVAGGHYFHARHHQGRLHVADAHAAGAYQGNADAVVGGNRLFFDQGQVFRHLVGARTLGHGHRRHCCRCCSGTQFFQEGPAGIRR